LGHGRILARRDRPRRPSGPDGADSGAPCRRSGSEPAAPVVRSMRKSS